MIVMNLRLVLSATVSSSAFRIGTTAAKGFRLKRLKRLELYPFLNFEP